MLDAGLMPVLRKESGGGVIDIDAAHRHPAGLLGPGIDI